MFAQTPGHTPAIEVDTEYGAYGDHLLYVLGWVGVFLISLFGALAGGAGGWFAGMGTESLETAPATIVGALIGFAIFGCIGFLAFGPASALNHRLQTFAPPDVDRLAITGMGSFDLYVTVHRVDSARGTDNLASLFLPGLKKPDSYVCIQCGRLVDDDAFVPGRNPSKRTCINNSAQFEEVFSFVIAPTDDTLEFTLYDQDTVGENEAGVCCVNITRDVLQAGFPQRRGYKLFADPPLAMFADEHAGTGRNSENRSGNLLLSFRPGEHFPGSAKAKIIQGNKSAALSYQQMSATQHRATQGKGQAADYGKWATSNHMAYGTLPPDPERGIPRAG